MSFFNNLSTLFGAQQKSGGQPRKHSPRGKEIAAKPDKQPLRQIPVQPLSGRPTPQPQPSQPDRKSVV